MNSSRNASPRHLYVLMVCLAMFPVFLLTIKGWVSLLLLTISLLSIYALWRNASKVRVSPPVSSPYLIWLVAALAMPVLAIGIAQTFRHELILRDYDGPMRLALAIPILLAIAKIDFPKSIGVLVFQYSIPATLFITFVGGMVAPSQTWGEGRLASYFADPLSFGSMCLALALITLATIDLFSKDAWRLRIFKLVAATLGIYLSIRSGSRTGWLAFPVVILILFVTRVNSKFGWIKTSLFLISIVLLITSIYFEVPTVHERASLGTSELLSYKWYSLNPDTSVGMRISFYRMAWFYFLQSPLGGWGDQGFQTILNAPEISIYASQYTREFPYTAGFHNEIATNMVRSGIWGLIATVGVFVIPLVFFISRLKQGLREQSAWAIVGLCYVTSTFISGMTTEVLNLKFTASFYAMLLAVLMGSILRLDSTAAKHTMTSA